MKFIESTTKEIIDTDFRQYAMYVLENRAIPSVIDGFKPVHRKLVYSMLNDHKGKRVKLCDLGGISRHNYHHGESSAIGAAITLSQEWNNNAPIFTSHGNFGSRLIQEAAAPRYIFASLSKDFDKYFIDTEVAPASPDVDNPEPAFYLPIIPWVLINGISGIAVGFATNILPRSIKSVAKATKECLDNPARFLEKNQLIAPTFPSFRGKVEHVEGNQWKTVGIIESTKGTEYLISELPIGHDRETYIEFLNTLCDDGKIRDYDDECSERGFQFRIKVAASQKPEIEKKDIMKFFKLEKLHSENFTTLGPDGKLKIFQSVAELIHFFVQVRTKYFGDKIAYDKAESERKIELMTDKIKFILDVVNNVVDFKTWSKTKLLQHIAEKITPKEHGQKFINIPLYECTTDAVEELKRKIETQCEILNELSSLTEHDLFVKRLGAL